MPTLMFRNPGPNHIPPLMSCHFLFNHPQLPIMPMWLDWNGRFVARRISDTDYNRREEYLKHKECSANNDEMNVAVLHFTNVYDKGYQAKMVAWKTGKQHILQPVQTERDRPFGWNKTLLSASVASDRACNESAVNKFKRAWYVSRGFTQNMSPKWMNDAQMIWSFQANCMYNQPRTLRETQD